MSAQLRLVTEAPAIDLGCAPGDDTRKIFEHWLFMLGRNPRRCKLGPTRRAAINAALTVHDVETLELAIDGLAADPLDGCTPQMREAMHEIEWLLAKESRVERWADAGEALHARVAAMVARRQAQQAAPAEQAGPTPEEAAQARERVKLLAARLSGRGG